MEKTQVKGSKTAEKKPPFQHGNGGLIIGFTHQCRCWLYRGSRTKRNPAVQCGTQKCRSEPYRLTPTRWRQFCRSVTPVAPSFDAVSSRVPPDNATSRFNGLGDKDWDNSKNSFQTQNFEFSFLSQRARQDAFGGSMAPKMPALKLNHPVARKPPAAIANESTRVAFEQFAKSQVAGLYHRWAK